jgi:asparagine synthase (glutamine-hydrolysing)
MGMGSFSQYVVAEQTARHRKVVLSGHGGDELFCGYPLFKAAYVISAPFSLGTGRVLGSLRAKEVPWVAYSAVNSILHRRFEFAPAIFTRPSGERDEFACDVSSSLFENVDRYYRSVYLPGLLEVEDKISMSFSLETRTPLWNQMLASYVAKIPVANRIQGGETKKLLKDAVNKVLPAAVFTAPKRGFPTPLRHWFRHELRDFVTERLTSGLLDDIVERADVRKTLDSHFRSRAPFRPFALDERRAHRIWMMLCLESWMRQYKVS